MQIAMRPQGQATSTMKSSTSGATLSTADGQVLPLLGTALQVEAQGGLARTTLRQTFVNPYERPLTVTYALPLPAEGAVSGFSFTRAGRTIVGEVDAKGRARKRFKRAIASGQTAAILEQERVNQFSQKVGNIPPGAEIVCEVLVDQKLIWRPEGAWEWRFPTVVGQRYMGKAGRVPDAERLDAPVARGGIKARAQLDLVVRDAMLAGAKPSSPSHELLLTRVGSMCQLAFGDSEGSPLNRDVVVRWPVVKIDVGLGLHTARPADPRHDADDAFGLLTIVPPSPESMPAPVPRDLIILIDTSGSMGGWPLKRATRLVSAMINTLDDADRIELIEFSSRPNRWQKEPVVATKAGKKAAISWVKKLEAGGCTEMRDAILEAIQPLRDDVMRQVVLITDGYIGFENEILQAIHKHLPPSARLHTIGVGDSVNRALTEPAARAGAGVEIVLGLNEPVEPAVKRLLERTAAPLVTDLVLRGDGVQQCVPARLPDLYAGSPALISARLQAGGGTIEVLGHTATGPFSHTLTYPAITMGEGNQAVTALFGREAVNDLEAWRNTTDISRSRGRETLKELDASVEEIGLTYQIATRLTSWIAVDEEAAVDPFSPKVQQTMPHEVPHGTSIASMGIRAPGSFANAALSSGKNVLHSLIDEESAPRLTGLFNQNVVQSVLDDDDDAQYSSPGMTTPSFDHDLIDQIAEEEGWYLEAEESTVNYSHVPMSSPPVPGDEAQFGSVGGQEFLGQLNGLDFSDFDDDFDDEDLSIMRPPAAPQQTLPEPESALAQSRSFGDGLSMSNQADALEESVYPRATFRGDPEALRASRTRSTRLWLVLLLSILALLGVGIWFLLR